MNLHSETHMGDNDFLINDGPSVAQVQLPVRVAEPAPVSDTKPWWASKGTIGAIVAVLALGLGMAGYQISAELQSEMVQAVLNVVALAGALVGLVGRLTASKRVV
jgi:hypothetical protein